MSKKLHPDEIRHRIDPDEMIPEIEPRQPRQERMLEPDPFVFTDRVIQLTDIDEYAEPMLTPAFLASVRQYGVMEPILVYRSGRDDGMYRIADGRRRALAAFRCGQGSVPAMVVTGGDNAADDFHKITLIANAQRGANIYAEYQAIMQLIKSGKSEKEIARDTGMSVATVKKRLKLNVLPTLVIDKLRAGAISAGAAEEATKLSPAQMQDLKNLLSSADTERVTHVQVKALRNMDGGAALADLPDQLRIPEVAQTPRERFTEEAEWLTRRYTTVSNAEMIIALQQIITNLQAGS